MPTVSGSRRRNGHVGRKTVMIEGVEVPLNRKGEPDKRWTKRMGLSGKASSSTESGSAVAAKGEVSQEVPSKRRGRGGRPKGSVDKKKLAKDALVRQESVERGDMVERGELKLDKKPVRAQISTFRQRCRDIVMDEGVQAGVLERARVDPEFVVKLANQGFGGVPQSLEVTANVDITKREIIYTVELQGGKVVPPAVAGLPATGLVIDSDGRCDDQRAPVGEDVHGG